MRIMSKEDARQVLHERTPDAFIAQVSGELRFLAGPYLTPSNSGALTALSKLVAFLLPKDVPVCLCVTGWGVWTEHLDLFYGYRRSVGETRPLIEAPVHVFERSDEDALVSVLCMVFYCGWDASLFDMRGQFLLTISHDGWLEIRVDGEGLMKDMAVELEKFDLSLLKQSTR